jgi:hypothetical protein
MRETPVFVGISFVLAAGLLARLSRSDLSYVMVLYVFCLSVIGV